jgi:glycosyltransferase involved in cell wall biosynthesis
MKILQVHNFYKQSGGEDVVVVAEREVLKSHGHDVKLYGVSNDAITGLREKIKTAWNTPYSQGARHRFAAELSLFRPDVAHVHNFFPLLTPSIYEACKDAGVPVVQALHNFRTICPGAYLLRKDGICEECLTGNAYRAVAYRCYRGSLPGSLAVARMVQYHRRHGTWREKVDCFIALSDFAKGLFVKAGFPEEKVAVKPNFLNAGLVQGDGAGGYALFAGRLSHEKGVKLLLNAWGRLSEVMPLKIVGDGPLAGWVAREAGRIPSVEWLGHRPRMEVRSLMLEASVLVFPSICYEGLPLSIIEAYSVGLPVIAGELGCMTSLVAHGRTGLHFRPGDARDLARQVEWALAHPEELKSMRHEARSEFDEKYTANINYEKLMEIYRKAGAQE